MKCPICGGEKLEGRGTRAFDAETVREKKCLSCGHVFVTHETLDPNEKMNWRSQKEMQMLLDKYKTETLALRKRVKSLEATGGDQAECPYCGNKEANFVCKQVRRGVVYNSHFCTSCGRKFETVECEKIRWESHLKRYKALKEFYMRNKSKPGTSHNGREDEYC